MKKQNLKIEKEFYGTATVGERGQIVIPAEARKAFSLNKGEKLLVFGMGDMLGCVKAANIERLASDLSSKARAMKTMVKKS